MLYCHFSKDKKFLGFTLARDDKGIVERLTPEGKSLLQWDTVARVGLPEIHGIANEGGLSVILQTVKTHDKLFIKAWLRHIRELGGYSFFYSSSRSELLLKMSLVMANDPQFFLLSKNLCLCDETELQAYEQALSE